MRLSDVSVNPSVCIVATQFLANCVASSFVELALRLEVPLGDPNPCRTVKATPVPGTTQVVFTTTTALHNGRSSLCLFVETDLNLELQCETPAQGISAGRLFFSRCRVTVPITCEVPVSDLCGVRVGAVATAATARCRETAQSAGGEHAFRLLATILGESTSEQFGFAVAPMPDLNGDGIGEFLAGGPGGPTSAVSSLGLIRVISGKDGQVLYTLNGSDPGASFGFSVAAVGDVDNDGVTDLLVGAPNASPGGNANAGRAFLFSGQTGALIASFGGTAVEDLFGWSVAGVGDVNLDGVPEFAIATISRDVGPITDAGQVTIYSGSTLLPLYSVSPPLTADFDSGAYGNTIIPVGDSDGDGNPGFLVGAPEASPGGLVRAGSAFLYSGATGALITQFNGFAAEDGLGWSAVDLGDVNGDGLREIAIGAPGSSPNGLPEAGSVFVFSTNGLLRYRIDGRFPGGHTGTMVAAADGVLIVGTPDTPQQNGNATGLVSLYNIQTGALIRDVEPPFSLGQFGWSGAGGNADRFAVGAPLVNRGNLAYAGAVLLYVAGRPSFSCTICVEVSVQVVRDVLISIPARRSC